MINHDPIFRELKNAMALHCGDSVDTNDLAIIADTVISQNLSVISVPPESVGPLWAWLEKRPTKIISQFHMHHDQNLSDGFDVSDLAKQINSVFKKGAHGANITVCHKKLGAFVSDLLSIRDDLFFGRDLLIGMDIYDINLADWPDILRNLDNIRADGLVLNVPQNRARVSDFVGRIYGFFGILGSDFNKDLYFNITNDLEKIEQVWRLAEKMRPEILGRLKFFAEL